MKTCPEKHYVTLSRYHSIEDKALSVYFCLSSIYHLKVKVAQSCLTLFDPMDYTVHRVLQAKILEWVDFPFSRESPQPRDRTQLSCITGGFFTSWAAREALLSIISIICLCYLCRANSLSLVWLFCDPMDCSPPGSFVRGILQARILEWVAIPFSKGSCYNPETWDWTQVSCIVVRLFTIWATREAQISIENGHDISYLCLKCEPVFYILWTFFSRGRIISNWIWPQ